MKRAVIIGGGFAGCAAAHQFALAGGWDVTLVEAGSQLGAGVRTQWQGGHPFTFGPRHVLTQDEAVWAFLDKYVPLRRLSHEFLTYVEADGQFYNYPINRDDIPRMPESEIIQQELLAAADFDIAPQNFEEYWLHALGPILYKKFIDYYSRKMWDVKSNKEIDTFHWSPKGVTLKTGSRAGWDSALSGYPIPANGYDDYFDIATHDAKVLLNTKIRSYDIQNRRVEINGEFKAFDVIVSTIAPDTLFDNCLGRLLFMGRDITTLVLPVEFALPKEVFFCYYAGTERYTRVTEYKKFTQHQNSGSTLISIEYPSKNGRLYPMPMKAEQARARQYFTLMPEGVYSLGRAGSYDYGVDIDDCIAQAMEMMRQINGGGHDHPVPLRKGA